MSRIAFWPLASLIVAGGGFLTFALCRHGWLAGVERGWDWIDNAAITLAWGVVVGGMFVVLPLMALMLANHYAKEAPPRA